MEFLKFSYLAASMPDYWELSFKTSMLSLHNRTIGYVANSPYTVKGESMSAGRLYDKIGGKAKGKIVFVTDGGVICKVISDGKDKPVMIEEDKVKDENL